MAAGSKEGGERRTYEEPAAKQYFNGGRKMYYSYDYDYNPGILSRFGTGVLVFVIILSIALYVLQIVALWKIYQKAGEKGWKAIVPFLNMYVLYKITWGNGWMFLLSFIPFANAVIAIITMHKLSVKFGHGVGFTLGLLFLNFIFALILGFGSSQYQVAPLEQAAEHAAENTAENTAEQNKN